MAKKGKPKSKVMFLDLDKYLGKPSLASSAGEEEDEFERELRKIRKRKLQKLADLELEKYLVEAEKELRTLKEKGKREEVGVSSSKDASQVAINLVAALVQDPKVQERWLNLTDEQRNTIVQSVNMLLAASKTSGAGASSIALMLPWMISAMQSNPSMTPKELVETVNMLQPQQPITLEGIAKLLEAAKEKGKKPEVSVTEIYDKFVKPMLEETRALREELAKERISRLEKEISALKNRPGFTEELAQKKEELQILRDILGGRQESITPELKRIDLEIEKIRQNTQMKLKEMELEQRRWIAQQQIETQRDERRWQVVQNLMQGPLGRVIQTMGGAAAAKISGSQPPKPILVKCPSCGGSFYASSDARVAACPHCNTLLKAAEGGESEVPPKQQEKAPAPGKEPVG